MRFRKETIEDEPVEDPTAWLLNESLATFFLMDTRAIQYMCMLGYTFFHGASFPLCISMSMAGC